MTTQTRNATAPARPARPAALAWVLIALGVAAAVLVISQAVYQPEAARRPQPMAAPAAPPAAAPSPDAEAEERLLSEKAFYHPVRSKDAPDFAGVGQDGKTVQVSRLRGKVVFVNFWATWCPPCIAEMPTMLSLVRDLAAKHPGRFEVVAVSGDDSWEAVNAYFSKSFGGVPRGITVTRDPDSASAKAYYCTARGYCPDIKFPETYVIDRQGKIAGMVVGPRDWANPEARQWLESLLQG